MDALQRMAVYTALGHLSRRWAGDPVAIGQRPAGRDLTPFEFRVFSQNGEDGVIAEVFRRVGTDTCRFVEFGAEDGREANCLFLAEVLGWEGLFIEGDPASYVALEQRFRDRPRVRTACELVTPSNINAILRGFDITGSIDILSIDIDGHDYWVWQAIEAVSPRLVVIEYNAHVPYPDRRVQPLEEEGPWRGTDYFGASLGALEYLARQLGYTLVHTDLAGVNAFFVREELLDEFDLPSGPPRRAANFFLTGRGHPPDDTGRPTVDPSA